MTFQFTPNQEAQIQGGVHWFRHSSKQTYEIAGDAGTGKSVTVWEIVRRLGLKPRQYMAMAYTGQASIVMRTKGFPNAKSIHSSLYQIEQHVPKFSDMNFLMNSTFNVPDTHVGFKPKENFQIDPEVELFIIDEGYMVPKQMRKVIEKFGRKVLVSGDPGQLPPIGGEPAYLTGPDVHVLTDIMRQAADNPIIYLAHRARRGLPIHCGMYGNSVLVIEDKDLTPELISRVSTIICGTNHTRDYMNKYVRENIRNIHSPIPVFGDRMICRNNNWNEIRGDICLANGLVGTIVNMPDLSSFEDNNLIVDFMPDLSNVVFDQIPIDYQYITLPYEERKQNKFRQYQTGEKFEYAYALTTHLAQGAEYPNGIYIEEFLRPQIQNQLNYTGITRFRNQMIYVKKSKNFQIFVS